MQTELYPSYYQVRNGLPSHGGQTIAEGIAVKSIGAIPLEIATRLVDDVVLVSEQSIEAAIHLLIEEESSSPRARAPCRLRRYSISPSGSAGRNVGLVICGGNIDTGLLANVIARVRLCEGRVVRMRVEIMDRPGGSRRRCALDRRKRRQHPRCDASTPLCRRSVQKCGTRHHLRNACARRCRRDSGEAPRCAVHDERVGIDGESGRLRTLETRDWGYKRTLN